jgi:hypothetical protein
MTARQLILKVLESGASLDDELYVVDSIGEDFNAYKSMEQNVKKVNHEYRRGFHLLIGD